MKIKNISVGDSVQVKRGLVSNTFKAKQVCEVMEIDSEHKFRPDVLIKGEYCLGWVNHNNLKKPIKREPEPQLKQLDQSIFDGLDEKWKSAATNTDGKAYLHNMPKSMMYFNHSSYVWCSKDYDAHEMQLIGDGFDPSGFAVGFIERDIVKELTGNELCRAMLARGDKYVMCLVSGMSDAKADSIPKAITSFNFLTSQFRANHDIWQYAVPINNQGEPLTASEAGL